MLQRLGDRLSELARKVVPDPFVLAVLLTLVTFVAALVFTGFDINAVLSSWLEGKGGLQAGVEPAKMVMALAYGDQWTNMLQPFWALPLLAITGIRAREMIGYTTVLLLVSQFVFLVGLFL